MKSLPTEIVMSKEFRASSLALRMVHQMIRPSLRRWVLIMPRGEAAQSIQQMLAGQGVVAHIEELERLITEATSADVYLWEESTKDGIAELHIYARPVSTLPDDPNEG